MIMEAWTLENPLWNNVADYAERCPWCMGKALHWPAACAAALLKAGKGSLSRYQKNESLDFAPLSNRIASRMSSYTLYISYVFVIKIFEDTASAKV